MRLPRPWADRRGRLSPLRAVVFALALAPGLWLLLRWAGGALGPKPLTEVLHGLGLWAIWFLLFSLMISPAKAIWTVPNIVVVRRMLGVTAMCYALLHLTLYIADQNFRLLHVASEIALRFYLTIGFVALSGLVALGWTSTDAWMKRLGGRWKKLHRAAYAIGVLAVLHFFIQSKADVTQAVLVSGTFAWLMLWRALPAGRDRGVVPLVALAVGASVLTLGFEFAWYAVATKIDPWRVLRSEFNFSFGLRPASEILALGLVLAATAELRRLAISGFAATLWFNVLLYAGGGLLADGAIYAVGWTPLDTGWDDPQSFVMNCVWMALFGLLGAARWRLVEPWPRRSLDGLWLACVLYPLYTLGLDAPNAGRAASVVMVLATLALTLRLWPVSRASALLVAPLAAWVAYSTTTLL